MQLEDTINGQYRGTRLELFRLAIVTALLTFITLGIYRFWAKTRVRQYIWASTQGGDDAFEYTGVGLEKLLGFLVAVVVLAVYLGLIQMVLFFFGMTVVVEPTTAEDIVMMTAVFYINLLALLPLFFYASYRARRYKMSRSRWRGVRLGMDADAWRYTLRACGYYVLGFISLGLLIPLASFKLEKFMADRSWFGDAKFEQNGSWTKLYGPFKHVLIGAAILLVGAVGLAAVPEGVGMLAVFIGYIWLMVGFVYYRVHMLRYMADNRTLGGEVSFTATPRTGEVIKIVLIGGLISGAILALIAALGMLIIFSAGSMVTDTSSSMIDLVVSGIGISALVLYVFLIVLSGALFLVFISQPILAHVATSVTVHNAQALDQIGQRAAAEGLDAEGFADALDLGGAF